MKTVDLTRQRLDLGAIIQIARCETVLLLMPDGSEFCIAEADDFQKEVEALRQSSRFQKLLEERAALDQPVPLDEVERQITREIAEKRRA